MTDSPNSPDFLQRPKRPAKSVLKTEEVLVALNFRVPFKLRQRLKLAAAASGMTMTEILDAALKRHLED